MVADFGWSALVRHDNLKAVSVVKGGVTTTPDTFVMPAFSSLNTSNFEPAAALGLEITHVFIPRVTHPIVDVAFTAICRGLETMTIDATLIFTSHRLDAV